MGAQPKLQKVKKFSWSTVDPLLIAAILRAVYEEADDPDEIERLDGLSPAALRASAEEGLGRPPAMSSFTPSVFRVLRTVWLPTAAPTVLDELVGATLLNLTGSARNEAHRTKAEKLAFIQNRNLTKNLKANLRKSFVKAHKEASEVSVDPGEKLERAALRTLVGRDAEPHHSAYPHQIAARDRFDQLHARGALRGHLVFPTGAGKTDTVVGWLLDQMNNDPDLRVLWLVHQQELVDQSMRRFVALAAEQPDGFKKLGRVFHSGAAPLTVLPDPKLDVAAVTYQSFRSLTTQKRKILDRYLSRPTIVVIDEAHHVGSASYDALLDLIDAAPAVRGLIGLTATPYPAGGLAKARFAHRFPEKISEVSIGKLVRQQVLASPVVTTIDTGYVFDLTDAEVSQAEASDIPQAVLGALDNHNRNKLILNAWLRAADQWGKTLVFVPQIAHANKLTELFHAAKVDAKALHSTIAGKGATLKWFREATGPCVLVSVGMLTEGVDLPDARTAFIARPTTSPILMRQMVGRVLRGPKAGGDPEAHVVNFRDDWTNLPDVVYPEEVLPTSVRAATPREEAAWTPGPVVDDEQLEIRADRVARIARAFEQLKSMFDLKDNDPYNDHPPEPWLSGSKVVGFYELGSHELPVFEHQLLGFEELASDALDGSLQGSALLSYFEDAPLPYPSKRSLRDFVDLVRDAGEAPPLLPCSVEIGAYPVAQAILQAGAMTDAERHDLIRQRFERSVNREVFPSLDRFEEAVEQQVRELRRALPRLDPEGPRRAPDTGTGLPILPRADRDLLGPRRLALEIAQEHLPRDFVDRLPGIPPAEWTKRPLKSSFAYWTVRYTGKSKGKALIRVNRVLRTRPEVVPDEALAYLIFHEMLHHLLPGQGHDAEFRELESLWPDATTWDRLIDTLEDEWDLDPKHYRDGGARTMTEKSGAPGPRRPLGFDVGIEIPAPGTDFGEVSVFALTYNGYERHGDSAAVVAIHRAVFERWQTTHDVGSDLDSLRCAVFFMQRAAHHTGSPLGKNDRAFLDALLARMNELTGGVIPGPPDPHI